MGVVVSDGFTGEGSTVDITAHTPDTTGTSYAYWFRSASEGISVSTGAIAFPATTYDGAHVVVKSAPDPTQADVDVELTLPVIAGGFDDPIMLFARGADANNWYCGYFHNDPAKNSSIYKNVASTITEIGAGVLIDLANADTIKLELRGTAIKIYVNDVEKDTATDSAHSAAGICGFGFGNVITGSEDVRFDWDVDDYTVTEFSSSTVVHPLISGNNLGNALVR